MYSFKVDDFYVCRPPTGSSEYANGIHHWGLASSQPSACTVEPGSATDVGKIVGFVIVPIECLVHCRCSC